MLMVLASVSGAVLVLLTGIFVGVLTLIWYIMMVERFYKVTVDNGSNNLMVWIHVNVCYL